MAESKRKPTADMSEKGAAHVYAEALLNAAEKKNAAEEVLEELDTLVDQLFDQQPQLVDVLLDRSVSREKKAHLIRSLFQERATDTFLNFLLVLNDHDRLSLLDAIQAETTEIWNQRQNRIRAKVRSAVPLGEDQLEKLKQQLQESFKKEPMIETEVDPELLGGLVVQVGDWLFDGSTRSRLERIKGHLIESGSHELEDRRDRIGTFGTD